MPREVIAADREQLTALRYAPGTYVCVLVTKTVFERLQKSEHAIRFDEHFRHDPAKHPAVELAAMSSDQRYEAMWVKDDYISPACKRSFVRMHVNEDGSACSGDWKSDALEMVAVDPALAMSQLTQEVEALGSIALKKKEVADAAAREWVNADNRRWQLMHLLAKQIPSTGEPPVFPNIL